MLSENDLSEIEMCLATITTEDRTKFLGDAAVEEIRALRKVVEAAKRLRDDEDGDQWNCQQRLFVALKEAGHA